MNFRGFRSKVNFFVSEVYLKMLLKCWVLLMFSKMVKSAMFCYVHVFFVFLCVVAKLSEKKFDSVYPVKGLETGGRAVGLHTPPPTLLLP